ncbi:hypothetical protein SAMN02949497_2775 [Methylomagnum ishizawai]|uniref:DUF4398 domain-containing protein n=1 Tax=Methylomagnum ishizawai TaxID=1760988 RepID=A0A1Y6D4F0_9GAMM|nr:hypothetical protein [Methylomagnum ishizawai]SMF95412.1 hypothetical protein SAMN02949497_2775 [Methylomagnum ishizawai]
MPKHIAPFLLVLLAACVPVPFALAEPPTGDAQISTLVKSAKTPADHLKIAALLDAEAETEAAKAKTLSDQAEAYREHLHSAYGKNIPDLVEHTDALAHSYGEAAQRHKALADLHRQMAAATQPQ